jgi:hypothetical protein
MPDECETTPGELSLQIVHIACHFRVDLLELNYAKNEAAVTRPQHACRRKRAVPEFARSF